MGVKNLWQLLAPYGVKKSIVELQGKPVAVDLSCWVCENQIVGEKHRSQQKFYLRNIFFRTAGLLRSNVSPIFILDGDPPEIKQATMTKRNKLRFLSKKALEVQEEKEKQKGKRKIFKHTLKECEEMLNILGLDCLWSVGEGEALCAFLDHRKIVDGIITQDSDAFLYGARKVYRNFSSQDGFGTVDVFEMSNLETHLNVTREKLIAMSLLCGCDYDGTGVHNIGPEKSLKYLMNFNGDVLQRFKCLRDDAGLEKYDIEKRSCKRCHHLGKQQEHGKLGCKSCGTESSCIRNEIKFSYDSLSDVEKQRVDFELKMWNAVKQDLSFPDENTINEYLHFSQEISEIKYSWREPDISAFTIFMKKKCGWCKCYSFEKIIPIYCRWALLNSEFTRFTPCKILKKRVLKAVPSFDIEWSQKMKLDLLCDIHENYKGIDSFTTIEPQGLIIDKCKELYEEFTAEILNKKLAKKKTGVKKKGAKEVIKENNDIKQLIETVGQLSITDSDVINLDKTNETKTNSMECELSLKESSGMCSFHSGPQREGTDKAEEEENHFRSYYDLNDSLTVDYDISDYDVDESLIVNNIIARRQYY